MEIIDVLVTNPDGPDRGVAASPNPASADPGEFVVWNFIPNSRTFNVVFKKFQPRSGGPLENIPPAQGPLSQSSTTQGQVVGIIASEPRQGRYFYVIEDTSDTRVRWLNGLTVENENFGGLDVPRPPGGGGNLVNKAALDADKAVSSVEKAASDAKEAASRAEKAASSAEKAASSAKKRYGSARQPSGGR